MDLDLFIFLIIIKFPFQVQVSFGFVRPFPVLQFLQDSARILFLPEAGKMPLDPDGWKYANEQSVMRLPRGLVPDAGGFSFQES